MNFYTAGEFAKLIGVTTPTLRNWELSGKFIPHHKSPSGRRYYSKYQLEEMLDFNTKTGKTLSSDKIFDLIMKEDKEGKQRD